MRDTGQASTQHPLPENTDEPLDESSVLVHLEAGFDDDDDGRRIRGIRNGVVLGALLWMLLAAVVVIAL